MWFELNGKSSEEFKNLVVKKLPVISSTPSVYEEIEIPGRGNVYRRKGRKNRDKSIECYLRNADDIDNIISWLSVDEEVVLKTSDEPDMSYYVRINDEINFEKAHRLRVFSIPLIIMPYKYDLDSVFTVTSGTKLNISKDCSLECYPLIELYDINSSIIGIYVNGDWISNIIPPDTANKINIDSQRFKITDQNGEMLNKWMNGDFPIFKEVLHEVKVDEDGNKVEKECVSIRITGASANVYPRYRWR